MVFHQTTMHLFHATTSMDDITRIPWDNSVVKGYQYWLNRYRTDLPQTENGKKSGK